MIRSLSFDNILNKKYEYIPFSKDFMDAFGKRQKSGAWIVYGKSGQGKTSFTFQLAREFDRIGYKVLFISLEMGVESDFRDSLLGFMNSSRSGMLFWDEVPTFDEFDEFLGKQRSPDVVIIDSLQSLEGEMDVTAKQLVELRKKYRKKIFVYISHVEGKEVPRHGGLQSQEGLLLPHRGERVLRPVHEPWCSRSERILCGLEGGL